MRTASILLAALGVLVGTGIVPATLGQAIMALVIAVLYFRLGNVRRVLSPNQILAIICLLLIAIINRQVEMASLVTIYMLSAIVPKDPTEVKSALLAYVAVGLGGAALVAGGYFVLGFNAGLGGSAEEVWRVDAFVQRNGLGFVHPNVAGAFYTSIIFALVGLITKRRRLWLAVIALGWVLIQTQLVSRTATYSILVCLVMLFLINAYGTRSAPRGIRTLVAIIPVILTGASAALLEFGFPDWLDSLFTGRFTLAASVYDAVGIGILAPDSIPANIDGSYFNALLEKGLLFTVAMLLLLVQLSVGRQITWDGAILLGTFFIYGATETVLSHPELLWPVALVSTAWESASDVAFAGGEASGLRKTWPGAAGPGSLRKNSASGL